MFLKDSYHGKYLCNFEDSVYIHLSTNKSNFITYSGSGEFT